MSSKSSTRGISRYIGMCRLYLAYVRKKISSLDFLQSYVIWEKQRDDMLRFMLLLFEERRRQIAKQKKADKLRVPGEEQDSEGVLPERKVPKNSDSYYLGLYGEVKGNAILRLLEKGAKMKMIRYEEKVCLAWYASLSRLPTVPEKFPVFWGFVSQSAGVGASPSPSLPLATPRRHGPAGESSASIQGTHQLIGNHNRVLERSTSTLVKNKKANRSGFRFAVSSPDRIAKVMSGYGANMIQAIEPHEWLRYAKGDHIKSPELMPNLCAVVERFKTLSYWVATEILVSFEPKLIAPLLKKLIEVAQSLLKLGNFNDGMAIISGLGHSSIRRLTDAWEQLGSSARSTLEQLEAKMDPRQNYKKYRGELERRETQKHIPYIGLVLRDLTYLVSGNDRYSGSKRSRANVDMCTMVSREINAIREMQSLVASYIDMDIGVDVVGDQVVVVNDDALQSMSLALQKKVPHNTENRVFKPLWVVTLADMGEVDDDSSTGDSRRQDSPHTDGTMDLMSEGALDSEELSEDDEAPSSMSTRTRSKLRSPLIHGEVRRKHSVDTGAASLPRLPPKVKIVPSKESHDRVNGGVSPRKWTVPDVLCWFTEKGMEPLGQQLAALQVSGKVLLVLNRRRIVEFGLLPHLDTLTCAIDELSRVE